MSCIILRILVALAGATAVAFWFWWIVDDIWPSTLLYAIASTTIFTSLVLAWTAAGLGGLRALLTLPFA